MSLLFLLTRFFPSSFSSSTPPPTPSVSVRLIDQDVLASNGVNALIANAALHYPPGMLTNASKTLASMWRAVQNGTKHTALFDHLIPHMPYALRVAPLRLDECDAAGLDKCVGVDGKGNCVCYR